MLTSKMQTPRGLAFSREEHRYSWVLPGWICTDAFVVEGREVLRGLIVVDYVCPPLGERADY